jgi:GNAT superfamily N-acetyltransferase
MSTLELRAAGLPAGPAVHVRRAAQRDRAALAGMFARCTGETRYRRFHGHLNVLPEPYLTEALSGSPVHFALVALADDGSDDGSVVGLASCRTESAGVAELGIMVEDAWQRLGIGGLLLRELVGHASRIGLTTLKAQILTGQSWIIRVLRRYGTCETARVRDVLDVTLSIDEDLVRPVCAPRRHPEPDRAGHRAVERQGP